MIKALAAALPILVLVLGADPPIRAADAPVAHHTVTFISHGASLQGTVYMPGRASAFAAAVWVAGAGETRRNPGLGQFLARRGLALLTYDKRGVGKSGGVYAGPEVGTNNVALQNITLLADDAAAAFQALRSEKRLHGVPVGFIGGSQAGWIIPLAARESRQACFMVLWSGAVETTHENLLFEQVAHRDPAFWSHHTDDSVEKIMAGVQDDLNWPDFDPRAALSRLAIPGLWMFGGRDRDVNVLLSIKRLNDLIAAGHANYSYRLFPDYDHRLGGERADIIDPSLAWIRQATATISEHCDSQSSSTPARASVTGGGVPNSGAPRH